jgi:hypothetical protein
MRGEYPESNYSKMTELVLRLPIVELFVAGNIDRDSEPPTFNYTEAAISSSFEPDSMSLTWISISNSSNGMTGMVN